MNGDDRRIPPAGLGERGGFVPAAARGGERGAWSGRVFTLLLLISLVVGAGCQRGPRNFANENDRLRRVNAELRDEVQRLSTRVETLQEEVQRYRRAEQAELPEGVEPPQFRRVEIGGYSGGVSVGGGVGGDGDNAVRLYLRTLDAEGRFVPTAARAEVTLAVIPAGREAQTVATATFGAEQFNQAYRSGFTGTHYTLIVPVDPARVPAGTEQLTARVTVTDLITGRRETAQATVPFNPPTQDEDGGEGGGGGSAPSDGGGGAAEGGA